MRRFSFIFLFTSLMASPPQACGQQQEIKGYTEFVDERHGMVQTQIENRGIDDPRVLEAMRRVPRHAFVPPEMIPFAHRDGPLPIGHGQTISQPYIVAFMTAVLDPGPDDRVLEIGTGSGYQAAILGELAGEVYTIEIVEPLAERSSFLLEKLGYDNVHVRHGDGYKGWPEQAPFDRIIVTAAPPEVPEALTNQLAEGGRLVIPVGRFFQHLKLIVKENGRLREEPLIAVRFVPMVPEN